VAKGTVYVYFRDREEVLAATADRLFDDLVAELEPAFTAEGAFAVRLHGLALRQLGFFDEHRALFRATLALSQRESDFSKSRSRCSARYTPLLEQLFAEAAAKGEIRRDAEPHTIASIYRDLVRGAIIRRLDPKSQKSKNTAEADAEFIVSVLLQGIQSGETS
jgi:AcrR family transcriptional regulator